MGPSDLEPDDLSRERLAWLHARIFCRENLVLGVTGDVSWDEVGPRIERLLEGWPNCPEALPEAPLPTIRQGGGVFLIPRPVSQSTVVMAHRSELRQADDPEYFASRIGNAILGAGGFQSRLMARVRTEEGYAYSVSSLWTAPRRTAGLVGAITRTRGETTVAAVRLILEVMEDLTAAPPGPEEVETAVSDIVNGFVFNFDTPGQIVARRMLYESEGLPEDWLRRYLRGVQSVGPADVHNVFRTYLRPADMTILVVGDPGSFDEDLSALGAVTILDPDRPGTGGFGRRQSPF
jgi:zinc protease